MRLRAWLVLVLACGGCAPGALRGTVEVGDSGAARDMNTEELDASARQDAQLDATMDAMATSDSGAGMDAGSAVDLGPSTDSGTPGIDLGGGCPALVRDDRAMWLWDLDPINDADARTEMFEFSAARQIRVLYMNARHVVSGSAAAQGRLATFVQDAHARCFAVEFVFGHTEYLLPADSDSSTDDRSVLYAQLTAMQAFITSNPTARPDGVHLDIEPHGQHPQWGDDRNGTANMWLDVLDAVQSMVSAMGLPLSADIPRWYDGVDVTRGGMTRPLSELTIDAIDHVAIMDYASNVTTIVNDVRDEIDYATSVHKSLVIGVEIGCADPATPTVSYWLQGRDAFNAAIESANTMLADSAVERFAVHDYQHYLIAADGPDAAPACPECGSGGYCP